ncbi:MAG: DUF935 domain-containing protein [Plesiomonas sp.]|uniref:DUF935 domain-containing protein n=1 Tax=Plesiomonas sp. TaxID=2486279 RepID=UPI003F2A6B50
MSQIVDQYGKPLKKDALKTPQTIKMAGAYHQYPEHRSRGMTIRKLPGLLQQAEMGMLSAQASFFEDMLERDGHVFAEMEKRKNALLTLERTIVPPDNASSAEKNATAAVRDWFSGILELEDVILNGATAIGHGFSCQEIQWTSVEKVLIPQSIHLRPHHWFSSLPEKGDELRLNSSNPDGDALWPFGWLVHRANARSGFVGSSGLFRVLVWPYLFKNFAVRDLAEFLEIYGLPARIAYYAPGTSDEDRDRLLMNLVRLGHDAVAAVPTGNDIKFESAASGGSDAFMAMIDWAERTASKVILGGTLTSQADGKTSTNALGNVHNEVRHDLLASDARQIEGMFRTLIQMMLALNGFGDIPLHRQPRLVFDTRKKANLSQFATAVSTLVNAGVETIPVNWVHKEGGIPLPQDGEAVIKPRASSLASLRQAYPVSPGSGIAALSQADNVPESDPGQQTIDGMPPLSDQVGGAMSALLEPMIAALTQGKSPDDAMNIVAEGYPQLDDGQLRALLTQAIFVTDLWGQLHANT